MQLLADGRFLHLCRELCLPYRVLRILQTCPDGGEFLLYLLNGAIELVYKGPEPLHLAGEMLHGKDAEHGVFAVKSDSCDRILRGVCGPGVPSSADMLYDRSSDSALCFENAGKLGLHFDWQTKKYRFDFTLSTRERFSFRERVCSDLFRIRHWQGVSDGHGFKTPPVGWMTWYSVRFDACEKVVLDNARKMKELFGEYVDKMILWGDWEWCHRSLDGMGQPDADILHPRPEAYPNGLKDVSDELKKMGFIPALWSGANNEGAINSLLKAHYGKTPSELCRELRHSSDDGF